MFRLTDEQAYAVELARAGDPLKIEAFAGTGKTSTLKAIGEAMPDKKCLYLAFNKSIADEAAKKFPGNVECRTSHSLAYREFGAAYRTRLNQKLNGDALAQILGIYEFHGIKPKTLCSLALETIRLFCQGNSREIGRFHVPAQELGVIGLTTDADAVADRVVQIARKSWEEMLKPKSHLPVTHDFYLKLWVMSNPVIHADLIMLDEAQDANSLLLGLLMQTIERGKSQVIFVGDRFQQIYSWRGAINAMQRFQAGKVARLTQSFRFGDAVADVANEVLTKILGSEHQIRGNPAKVSRLQGEGRPRAILCRTNSECIRQVIHSLESGLRVHLQGGTSEFKATIRGIEDLRNGRMPQSQTLSLFTSYDQLVEFSKTELGRDLQPALRLIDEYTAPGLLDVIASIERNSPESADVVVSTGHKAKGREWESVRLGNDFRAPKDKGYHDEDGNLLYVAVTRAIETLDITQLAMFENGKLVQDEAEEHKKTLAALELIAPGPISEAPEPLEQPKRKGATTGPKPQATIEQMLGYLRRAREQKRITILASSELAEEAFSKLDDLLEVQGDPRQWVEAYMSSSTRKAMYGAIRKANFHYNHEVKKLDIKRDVADRFLKIAEANGLSMSEMLDRLMDGWKGNALPGSKKPVTRQRREPSW
jgi:macrodomain Ter protein organizer (MatP/YcbG family)